MVILLGKEEARRMIVIDSKLRVVYDTGDTGIIEEEMKKIKIEAVKEAIKASKGAILLMVKKRQVDIYCYEEGEELPAISITLLPDKLPDFDELQDMLERIGLDSQKALTLLSFALSLLNLS